MCHEIKPNQTNLTKIGYIYVPRARSNKKSIFPRSLTGLNSKFYFSLTSCHTKVKEPNLPYYLPVAEGRIIRFIPFSRE